VLFTDIVGSTQQARRLGDRRWPELLNVHDELARRLVEQAGGCLVKTTGNGILATFDGPRAERLPRIRPLASSASTLGSRCPAISASTMSRPEAP
jgi:class 3 adenylate cyclase